MDLNDSVRVEIRYNIVCILIIDLNVYCLSYDKGIRKCNGGADDEDFEHCCSEENPCNEGEGDCDISSDCKGDLVCGTDNCDPDKYSQKWVDCCEKYDDQKSYYGFQH